GLPLVPAAIPAVRAAAVPLRALLDASVRQAADEVEVRRLRLVLVIVVRAVLILVDELGAAATHDAAPLGVVVVLSRVLDEALHPEPLRSLDVAVEAEEEQVAVRYRARPRDAGQRQSVERLLFHPVVASVGDAARSLLEDDPIADPLPLERARNARE